MLPYDLNALKLNNMLVGLKKPRKSSFTDIQLFIVKTKKGKGELIPIPVLLEQYSADGKSYRLLSPIEP